MNSVNQTLYIPLYGKAWVSRKGILLQDPKAEQIWAAEGFELRGKSASQWLAYYMGMRAAVFDRWLEEKMEENPDAVILHLGCGMDSRCQRVDARHHMWFDVDFPDVMMERKRYYRESDHYRMIGADIRQTDWLDGIPEGNAVVVMEGVSMYLQPQEQKRIMDMLCTHFRKINLLMDCYTEFAASASRVKNPINDVGVKQVWGTDDPESLQTDKLRYIGTHNMTPPDLVNQLQGMERAIFRAIYAGAVARKMYRLYEYGGE